MVATQHGPLTVHLDSTGAAAASAVRLSLGELRNPESSDDAQLKQEEFRQFIKDTHSVMAKVIV